MSIQHQNNFATNLTSNQTSGVTTTPLNSIPSVAAPFYIALDATNINGKYEIVFVTSKTATNINHAATTYAHTTAEEVRMVLPAAELDKPSNGVWDDTGNEIIKVGSTASAVNEITVTNAATAGVPTISATGDDTNIHLNLQGKANGLVKISVLRKDDTTNVYSHQSVILTGWGYQAGDATNKLKQKTETFGITFGTAPVVIIGLLGAITGGTVPTSIGQAGDTGTLSDSNGIWIGASGISTTGFTANIRIGAAGSTWASTVRIMYSYIAIGTL